MVVRQKVSSSMMLSTGMPVLSTSVSSLSSFFLTSANALDVGTLVNRLTTSKLTIWVSDVIDMSLMRETKCVEFFTYDGAFFA